MLKLRKIQSTLEARLLGIDLPVPFWLFEDKRYSGFWAAFREAGQALWEAHWGGSGSPFRAKTFCEEAMSFCEKLRPGLGFFSNTPIFLPKALKMAKALKFQALSFSMVNQVPCLFIYRRL